eukprot:TRINITY_DN1738_c0_g3_i3.p1 TRINITY_DN1738_c0_g3~~TRINITY_DN1738_c0_g3_i3.p1  ORF type:complete len:166 (-),score=42.49 TRINITY_DN1738_c0_g3_i3:211-708(-)
MSQATATLLERIAAIKQEHELSPIVAHPSFSVDPVVLKPIKADYTPQAHTLVDLLARVTVIKTEAGVPLNLRKLTTVEAASPVKPVAPAPVEAVAPAPVKAATPVAAKTPAPAPAPVTATPAAAATTTRPSMLALPIAPTWCCCSSPQWQRYQHVEFPASASSLR